MHTHVSYRFYKIINFWVVSQRIRLEPLHEYSRESVNFLKTLGFTVTDIHCNSSPFFLSRTLSII